MDLVLVVVFTALGFGVGALVIACAFRGKVRQAEESAKATTQSDLAILQERLRNKDVSQLLAEKELSENKEQIVALMLQAKSESQQQRSWC